MLGFIQANAEAPPIGFDVLERVAADLGAFWSSELTLFESHRIGRFSAPPTWLLRLDSPDERDGAGSYDAPVRAEDDERLVAVAELVDLDGFNTFMFLPLPPRVGRWYPLVVSPFSLPPVTLLQEPQIPPEDSWLVVSAGFASSDISKPRTAASELCVFPESDMPLGLLVSDGCLTLFLSEAVVVNVEGGYSADAVFC